jgi:hypothetical protein
MDTSDKVAKEVKKAINSEDVPLENRSPTAPFAMVGLSYLIVLALFGIAAGLVLYLL